ncbi:MAG TPA: tetratricopeptide repeat protein [Candidatus Acidoferrales bacterium]|nr:tetratricopeptide repeat protein [Candidatus Acidoferrales bacterium]
MKKQWIATISGGIVAVAFCAAGAAAQTTSPVPQASTPASTSSYSQMDPSKRAEAYTDFMLGHLAEQQFDETGKSDLAGQAIEYYQKAHALDSDAAITERLAEVYAASQRTDEAIRQAQSALQQDPNNLAAHRLLARIYIHNLGDMSPDNAQKETISLAVDQLKAVQRLDPTDVESQLWLAHLYGFQNKPQQTEQVLRGILSHAADNEGALEQLSQLYLDEGRTQDAISLLKNAAGVSNAAGLYDLLGTAYAKSNNFPKAEGAFQRAVTLEPEEASHRKGLAQALLSNHKYDQALTQYERLTKIEPDNPENYLRMSQIYRHLDQLDKSESNLMQAKKYAPGSLEVLYNEALLYEAQARYKDAIQVLSDAIAGVKAQQKEGQHAPNALTILYEQLGMAYRQSGDFSSAERAFEDMQQLGPASQKRGELLLIDTYRTSGDIKRAIAEAEKARAADSNDQSLAVTYAMLLGDNGQTDDATKVLRGLLGGNQTDRETYLDLAQIEERGKRYADAQTDANKALGMSNEDSDKETAWFLLGSIYDGQKQYDQAEQMFRKALAINPHDAMVLNYYGYMLADRGIRLDEAITMIHSAVVEDPTNGAYLDSLGWAYFKQGHLAEAQQYLQQAVSHSANDPTVLGHLGEVYAKLGQTERAEQVWEKALSCWHKALPADYEAEKVSALEAKLKNLKRHRLAEKSFGGDPKP